MSTPFLGELKIISWNFAPKGWALCNGQLLPINQNQALFSILGTTYGGDGRVNFALPDLRGRVPVHRGGGFILGQKMGQEFHTITVSEMAQHIHFAQASPNNGDQAPPTGNYLAPGANLYAASGQQTTLLPATIGNVGGSQPHENRQPWLTLNIIIALQGIFPSQN
ncbi:MAG TPA: tail fiber protein [Allosphingosinicella sp.]|nr:tail fiber protein [Allosphingosinicella sp.]